MALLVFYGQVTKNYGLLVWEFTLAPFIYALWNVMYFVIQNRIPKFRIDLWGAALGLIFGLSPILYPAGHRIHAEATQAVVGIFVDGQKFDYFYHNIAWLWLPVLYFFIWRYVIRWFNNLWECKC